MLNMWFAIVLNCQDMITFITVLIFSFSLQCIHTTYFYSFLYVWWFPKNVNSFLGIINIYLETNTICIVVYHLLIYRCFSQIFGWSSWISVKRICDSVLHMALMDSLQLKHAFRHHCQCNMLKSDRFMTKYAGDMIGYSA